MLRRAAGVLASQRGPRASLLFGQRVVLDVEAPTHAICGSRKRLVIPALRNKYGLRKMSGLPLYN